MKKKSLLLLSILLLVVFAAATGVTYAWLTYKGTTGEFEYIIGTVDYEIQDPSATQGYIVPSQEIFSGLTIENKSNVDTNLRAKFTVTATLNGQTVDWTIGSDENNDEILLTLNGNNNSTWVYNESDGYYYFNSINETDGNIPSTETNIECFFTNLVLNGELIKNQHSNISVTISLTFEAKQAKYVLWNQIQTFTVVMM